MSEFKVFLQELLHADSVTEVLLQNRKETVKLAAGLVLLLSMVLLYMHHGNQPLEVSDAADGSGSAYQAEAGAGSSAAAGSGEGSGSGQHGPEGAGADGSGATAEDRSSASAPYDTDGIVYVDIDGAVKHPMLASLPTGSRVEDAIQAAGGLRKNADLSQINRARILADGEKVYIPAEGEESIDGSFLSSGSLSGGSGTGGSPSPSMAGISGGRININTADTILLQQLTGVGPVTAQKIVDYRDQNGKFSSIEDLKNVSGIGEKTFEKLRDDITI